eukprot:5746654-Alexandrium_andersonii.AAC.1
MPVLVQAWARCTATSLHLALAGIRRGRMAEGRNNDDNEALGADICVRSHPSLRLPARAQA